MAWTELHQAVWTHRKTLVLAAQLGLEDTYAAAHMARLWSWALDNAPTGSLSGLPAAVIAVGAGWRGDPDQFVDAAVQAGYLDRDADTLTLHDWHDYAGRLIEKRRANVERTQRWRAQNESPTNAPVMRNERARYDATVPNRTVPDRTVPETPATAVVLSPTGATATATPPQAPVQLTPEARTVVDEWRRAHGKRSPPKLNPTQVAKLDQAVAELGVERLLESMRWSAEAGLSQPSQFTKAINAAYSKRKLDEDRQQEQRNGRNPVSSNGAGGDRFAAFRQFG